MFLKHFLGCYATRISGSGLELITQKWGHSLVELDLAWSSATEALDMAVSALAEVPEKGITSPLRLVWVEKINNSCPPISTKFLFLNFVTGF